MSKKKSDFTRTVLGFVTGGVAFALLFVWWVYPEVPTASYAMATLLLALLGVMAWMNQRELKAALQTRSLRYGTNAAVTVGLVIAILTVLNFLNYNHYVKKDLTKGKRHTLSDQTIKILKDLKQEARFTVFVKTAERDSVKGTIDNFAYYASKNLKVEYVDPDRDPTRAKAANVKKYGTVIIQAGKRDTRVEEVTEEKLANALLKVLKDKVVTVCFMSGHGEKTPDVEDAESYSQIKKEFASQNYESKTFNLLEEGKIPEACTVLLVLGPSKAFFDKEISLLSEWLDNGGRAVFAIDPNLKNGVDTSKEIAGLLEKWWIRIDHNLVLDPTSRLLGVNASVPIVGMYNKENPITREFQLTTLFPLASGVDIKPGQPTSLKTWWLAKSTPKAWAKTNFKEIATGMVKIDEKKDVAGPHSLMVAVEGGRDPSKKPARPTRIIALGSSGVGANRWASHGANIDLFLNSVSWLADDENLISIRPKEEEAEVPSLSQTESNYIQLVTMIMVPGGMLLLGALVWFRRRKL